MIDIENLLNLISLAQGDPASWGIQDFLVVRIITLQKALIPFFSMAIRLRRVPKQPAQQPMERASLSHSFKFCPTGSAFKEDN